MILEELLNVSTSNDVVLKINSDRQDFKVISEQMEADDLARKIDYLKSYDEEDLNYNEAVNELLDVEVEDIIVENNIMYIYLHDDEETDYSDVMIKCLTEEELF